MVRLCLLCAGAAVAPVVQQPDDHCESSARGCCADRVAVRERVNEQAENYGGHRDLYEYGPAGLRWATDMHRQILPPGPPALSGGTTPG